MHDISSNNNNNNNSSLSLPRGARSAVRPCHHTRGPCANDHSYHTSRLVVILDNSKHSQYNLPEVEPHLDLTAREDEEVKTPLTEQNRRGRWELKMCLGSPPPQKKKKKKKKIGRSFPNLLPIHPPQSFCEIWENEM